MLRSTYSRPSFLPVSGEVRPHVAALALHLVAAHARGLGLLGKNLLPRLRVAALDALAPAGEGIVRLPRGFECGELLLNRGVLPLSRGFEQIEHEARLSPFPRAADRVAGR